MFWYFPFGLYKSPRDFYHQYNAISVLNLLVFHPSKTRCLRSSPTTSIRLFLGPPRNIFPKGFPRVTFFSFHQMPQPLEPFFVLSKKGYGYIFFIESLFRLPFCLTSRCSSVTAVWKCQYFYRCTIKFWFFYREWLGSKTYIYSCSIIARYTFSED